MKKVFRFFVWAAATVLVLSAEGAVEEWPAARLALGYRTSVLKAS